MTRLTCLPEVKLILVFIVYLNTTIHRCYYQIFSLFLSSLSWSERVDRNIVQISWRSTLPTGSLKNFSSSRSGKTFSHRHTSYYLFTARSFQFMSALLKYSQLMQNNGKDALTKIKDSKINLACNICDTLLL